MPAQLSCVTGTAAPVIGPPRVLFLSGSAEDYLADGLFHGLRSLLGKNVVDHPRMDIMYDTIGPIRRRHLYGRGFSLYGGLPDLEIDRVRVEEKLADGHFNIVIFSDIHRMFGRFVELLPLLSQVSVAVLDGADSSAMYPYCGTYWRRPERWFLPRAHTRFLYFKREWTIETLRDRYYRLVPRALLERARAPANLRPIGFSFPHEKILTDTNDLSGKRTLFQRHIVDPEVRESSTAASASYVFESEVEYYRDLREACFGITTKRGGWDCLRHYEIAANGTVPCFRDLAAKPPTCAPHGLTDDNCISYGSAKELLHRVSTMSEAEYVRLRKGALAWARENSTQARAKQVLAALGFPVEASAAEIPLTALSGA